MTEQIRPRWTTCCQGKVTQETIRTWKNTLFFYNRIQLIYPIWLLQTKTSKTRRPQKNLRRSRESLQQHRRYLDSALQQAASSASERRHSHLRTSNVQDAPQVEEDNFSILSYFLWPLLPYSSSHSQLQPMHSLYRSVQVYLRKKSEPKMPWRWRFLLDFFRRWCQS